MLCQITTCPNLPIHHLLMPGDFLTDFESRMLMLDRILPHSRSLTRPLDYKSPYCYAHWLATSTNFDLPQAISELMMVAWPKMHCFSSCLVERAVHRLIKSYFLNPGQKWSNMFDLACIMVWSNCSSGPSLLAISHVLLKKPVAECYRITPENSFEKRKVGPWTCADASAHSRAQEFRSFKIV